MSKNNSGILIQPVILLISVWQRIVSPLFGDRCRFTPSCSEYAKQALKEHGLLKGLYLASKRILRCNSLFRGGEDPVPEREPS